MDADVWFLFCNEGGWLKFIVSCEKLRRILVTIWGSMKWVTKVLSSWWLQGRKTSMGEPHPTTSYCQSHTHWCGPHWELVPLSCWSWLLVRFPLLYTEIHLCSTRHAYAVLVVQCWCICSARKTSSHSHNEMSLCVLPQWAWMGQQSKKGPFIHQFYTLNYAEVHKKLWRPATKKHKTNVCLAAHAYASSAFLDCGEWVVVAKQLRAQVLSTDGVRSVS